MASDNAAPFIAARDLLLRLTTDYDAAIGEFRWPVMQQSTRRSTIRPLAGGRFGALVHRRDRREAELRRAARLGL
jgi:hypothetical protein